MNEAWLRKFWGDKWRLATCLVPALAIVLFAHQALIPLATELRDLNSQLSTLRENTYEKSWLDSAELDFKQAVTKLKLFQQTRESALISEKSIQETVDHIRGLAQASRIEITKTTPILGRADRLRLLKIKMEGFTNYRGMIDFFDTLHVRHPNLYLEEMLIRQGGERARGRLDCQLIVNVYDRKRDEGP